jgi:hypothetical protein
VGTLWLVLLGPLLVVLASLATAVIAFNAADQVLNDDRAAAAVPAGTTAAIAARNHAATPAR